MQKPADIEALNKKANQLGLSPEQIMFAHNKALPKAYRKTMGEMADELGVHIATLYRWKMNRRVLTLTNELMKRYFMDDLPDILEAMKVKAVQGSEAAAKLVIEYINDYMENKHKINGNITQNNIYVSQKDVENQLDVLKNKVIDIKN